MKDNVKRSLKNKVPVAAVAILILATLAFIWGNSLESIPESQGKSLGVMRVITPVLEIFVGRGNVTDHLVRKLAHFAEFGALGFELAMFVIFRRRVRLQSVINCLFFGLATAVTDEAIQIFTDRGSQVQDVLLDFSGALTGLALTLILYALIRKIRQRTDKGTEQTHVNADGLMR